MTQPTDRQLIDETLAGNQRAFAQLVARHSPQVATTIINMLGKGMATDDVGQEVFIRLYRSLPNFRHESSLSTYLTRIAINLCLNELKRRRVQQQRFRFLSFSNNNNDTDETPSDLQIPDLSQNYAEQLANQELLNKSLQRLDDNLRAVVVLRLVEGYSTQETADLLHIPLGTVLSRLARAQAKLRQLLHNEE